jgi:uncharacterized membrane protein
MAAAQKRPVMGEYFLWKWLHVVSSTIVFGTGIGTAFHLLMAARTRSAPTVAVAARQVVWADWLFTAPTMVFQPASGLYLMHLMGLPVSTPWILRSLMLYGLALCCWLPVVWIQMKLRDLAVADSRQGIELGPRFWLYFRWWVVLGFPALFAFLAIFWLMVAKPA